ncbi:MAG: cytidylate kinase-like family protein [Clostridiales bacterium]|nr:cytidylate kinase-like family protein [Candidatus Blautia equi]
MAKRIITISREFGSGGRYIGEHLANRLGYELYDRDLISRVIQRTLLPESMVVAYNEAMKGNNHFSNLYLRDTSVNDTIIDAQRKIILEIAEKKDCIIVGRCANHYLREWDEVLNVFIESDPTARIKRIAMLHNCSEADALRMREEYDKKRSLYYQYCTNHSWADRTYFDIILNSNQIGLDRCVDILEMICKEA